MKEIKLDAKLWHKIHTKALNCKDDHSKKKFLRYIKKLYSRVPCEKCKIHMKDFMKREYIKKYWNYHDEFGYDNGFFYWTWKFHNDVNSRLNKQIIGYSQALGYFSNVSKYYKNSCGC